MALALSGYPLAVNHRGLCGMKKSSTKNSDRGNDTDPEHAPPHLADNDPVKEFTLRSITLCDHERSSRIRIVRRENPDGDGKLIQRDHAAAVLRDRDFGDVQRREHRGDADPQSADEPRENQRHLLRRDGASERRDGEQECRKEQRGLAAEPVGQDPRECHADDAAQQARRRQTILPANASSANCCFTNPTVPDMTAVSKPKRNPPSADTRHTKNR